MAIRTYAGLALEARGLRAGFAERGRAAREILDVRHLRVDGGSQVAICGPSGSGKTTLLHLLAGLERPRRGVIRWGEVEVTALPERVADRVAPRNRRSRVPAIPPLSRDCRRWRTSCCRCASTDGRSSRRMRARALKLLDRVGVRPDGDVAVPFARRAAARGRGPGVAAQARDRPGRRATASLDRDTANVVADLLCSMCRGANATLVVTTHDRFDRRVVSMRPTTWSTAICGRDRRMPRFKPLRSAA